MFFTLGTRLSARAPVANPKAHHSYAYLQTPLEPHGLASLQNKHDQRLHYEVDLGHIHALQKLQQIIAMLNCWLMHHLLALIKNPFKNT